MPQGFGLRRQIGLQARIAGAGRTPADSHSLLVDVLPRLEELTQGGGDLRISLSQPTRLPE